VGGARERRIGRRPVADFGSFKIRSVSACGAMDHGVFAVFGQHHEFMAGVAADGSAFGFDNQIVESRPIEDAAIGLVHNVVAVV